MPFACSYTQSSFSSGIRSILCGLFCALAGAYLSMGQLSGTFSKGMSDSRGYIAFACVIFAAAHPGKAYLAALMFGFFDAIGMRLQAYVSSELTQMIPYIITILMMIYVVVRQNNRRRAPRKLQGMAKS